MVGRLCPTCGVFLEAGSSHSCKKGPRSRRRRIYDDHRWRATREYVFERDGRRCAVCGRHESELAGTEVLYVDHWPLSVLEVADPYDPATCRCVCSTCGGKVDGARAQRPAKKRSVF